MAFNIKLWQASGDKLQEIGNYGLEDEQRLETWIAADPSILGMDVLLIGRQITTINRGRIDLLALDSDANVVIFELKRDMTPREVVAQALELCLVG
jgi:RecB family endonuclease NucS